MQIKLINLIELPVELRLNTRNWRNQENVSKYFKIKYIDEKTHKKWLNSLFEDNPKTIAFVIYLKDEPVSLTYFHSINIDLKYADWGIYIHKENIRSKGIGNYVLRESIRYAKEILRINTLYWDVKNDNYVAIKLYENNNFVKIASDPYFSRYKNILLKDVYNDKSQS